MAIGTNVVDRFSHWDPRNKRVAHGLGVIIASALVIPTMFIALRILIHAGYSSYIVLPFFLLVIPVIFLHELIHAAFQWLFGKQRPQLGFKFPFAFSKLRPNVSISRNQGIVSALSPFLLITSILILTALFVNPLSKVALIIVVYLHTPTCSGDFHFTSWLLRRPSNTRLRVEDMNTVVFYKQNTRFNQNPRPSRGL